MMRWLSILLHTFPCQHPVPHHLQKHVCSDAVTHCDSFLMVLQNFILKFIKNKNKTILCKCKSCPGCYPDGLTTKFWFQLQFIKSSTFHLCETHRLLKMFWYNLSHESVSQSKQTGLTKAFVGSSEIGHWAHPVCTCTKH